MSAAPSASAPAEGAAAPAGTGLLGGGAPADAPASERSLADRIVRGDVLVVVLAFVFAFLIGSALIIVADEDVRAAAGYFFARPQDTLGAAWTAITEAYAAMFRGAIFDYQARTPARAIKPLTETLTIATPLIIAACGMAVGFRAGLFNIGGTGQLITGAMAAAYIGFTVDLPPVLHLLVALVAGVAAGAIWGGIAGFLKARFGANEVITTIMLNWIAVNGLNYALKTTAFTGANKSQPVSPAVADTAALPQILGPQFRLHLGIVFAIGAIVFLWWLMNRSAIGFRFRAVGSNPRAAEVAGIDVGRSAIGVMVTAGALVGLAGAVHLLGTEHKLTGGIAGSVGFDAITVALLGRSGPIGILLAGLLFAALGTGGRFMETTQGVPLDLVQVIQALVVLFIAAPPLVRSLVGLGGVDRPGTARKRRARRRTEATDVATAEATAAEPSATTGSTAVAETDAEDTTPAAPAARPAEGENA
ncbi:ABC transporter permease [Brachybacterium nesterenkovii]|uniref:Nucleoside ABC transporter, permease protein 1 n=1 Tax=Brachybacterium nesterenkovii TaxID=47847 RepID=A0A1X6X8H6_9MICO|nr:ABC transporter permease [Brachybacterium nesterenkovii]SLM95439.1 Nucleoside ABC transporter, permease protein 1 [Brachybacterium nesterenkovii]